MPSDNAWNPQPPPGKEQLLLYLQVDFNPLKNVSRRNEIFLIEFARQAEGEENPTEAEGPAPGDSERARPDGLAQGPADRATRRSPFWHASAGLEVDKLLE